MSKRAAEWLPICDTPRGGVCARRALLRMRCGATVKDGPAKGDEADPETLGPPCGRGERSLVVGIGRIDGPGALVKSEADAL